MEITSVMSPFQVNSAPEVCLLFAVLTAYGLCGNMLNNSAVKLGPELLESNEISKVRNSNMTLKFNRNGI